MDESIKDGFKINFTMIQNSTLKNSVTSIWKYDSEIYLNEVRKYLSKHNTIPNSWYPEEIVFTGDVILESN